jgi:hypothetical protein
MSLEELLKDADHSSRWKAERKKLLRIGAGILISSLALIAGVFLVLSLKKRPPESAAEQRQVDSLAQLMQLRRQTDQLKDDIHRLRAPASTSRARAVGGYSPKTSSDTHVVNYDPGEGFSLLKKDKPDVYIPTGAVFQAQLITPIKTSVERTFVMAEVTNEYRMDMKRRILKGSRLIGRSHFDPVLKGVVVEFNTVVSPAGIETPINALALSRNALPEIEGLYFSDKFANYGTALAFGFLSGFADAARERESTLLGSQPTVSLGNQVLTGLSTASFEVANEMLRDIRSTAIEYVVVPAGERVFVVLTRRYDIAEGGSNERK